MLNVGLIGLGKMGISHLAIVSAHPEINLIGVCDTSAYVRGALHKSTGVQTYSNYQALLDAKDLDAVVIATPSRYHTEMVRSALDRNLNVFCEKPFCLNVTDGLELAELAERKGLINQVGYHNRFVATFREAKRLVDANVLGRIHHVQAEAFGPVVLQPKGSTWRASGSEGGGCLYDYACHAIDMVNYLVGRPQAVGGTVINKIFSRDVDDEVYATLYFPNGMTGQIAANWSDESYRKMSTQVSVWGTNGRMVVDRQEIKTFIREADSPGVRKGWNVQYTTDLPNDVWYYLRGEEYSAQIDYFVQCVRERRTQNISSFASAVETDLVVSMLLKDADKSRQALDFPKSLEVSDPKTPNGFLRKLKNALT
jgi:scyllo-inositol 2-dehydrogenase (NADP+)